MTPVKYNQVKYFMSFFGSVCAVNAWIAGVVSVFRASTRLELLVVLLGCAIFDN